MDYAWKEGKKMMRMKRVSIGLCMLFCVVVFMCGCRETATEPTQKLESTNEQTESKQAEIQSGENEVQIPVQIHGEDATLEGCLWMPEQIKEKPKLVILVHGSGQSDMNETIGDAGNTPFRDIAEGLAKKGIATLRYNKRYFQYADKADDYVTIQDEVLDDVTYAIQFVEALDCCSDIYIAGHSMGGMLAPVIAKENEEVKGIILLAGTPRTLQDIIYDQNVEALDQNRSLSGAQRENQLKLVKYAVDQINKLTGQETEKYLGVPACYWYSLNQLHHDQVAKELNIPMLIMQGSADFQVYPDKDFKQWKSLLGDRKNVSFHLYEGLNHLFMKTNGKRDVSEYNVKGNVASEVIQDMADWVLEKE